ncbi:hypothetical protein EDC04DRAFT_2908179 [Pisolithus marmoratus]|nr:hypothetical protein EDC04DRAFT_2908179 [Pisolithus marmoratus]
MSSRMFNITPRMIHLQVFNWLKQFIEGSIMMHMALDSIEFVLGPDFDSDEWMDLTHCVVMELGCWSDIEKIFMRELGIEKSSSKLHVPPSGVPIMSGPQGSASADPLLKDPFVWRLVMDWAQDKIGYCELDDKMQAYGSHYVHAEWKGLINKVFMQSEPGADNTVSAPLLVQRAMESHGVSLMAGCVPVLSAQAIRRCHSLSCGVTQKKRCKVKASIFLDIDAKDEGEQDEEGEEEDEEAEDEGD